MITFFFEIKDIIHKLGHVRDSWNLIEIEPCNPNGLDSFTDKLDEPIFRGDLLILRLLIGVRPLRLRAIIISR